MAKLDRLAVLDGTMVSYNDLGYVDLYGAIHACVKDCKQNYRSAKALYKKLLRDALEELPSPPEIRVMGKVRAVNFTDFTKIFEKLADMLPASELDSRWLATLNRAVGPGKQPDDTNQAHTAMGSIGHPKPEPVAPAERCPMGYITLQVPREELWEEHVVQCLLKDAHAYVRIADVMKILRPDDKNVNGTWRRALRNDSVCLRYQPEYTTSNAKYIRAADLEDLVKAVKAEELLPWALAIFECADEWGSKTIMLGIEEADKLVGTLPPLGGDEQPQESSDDAAPEEADDAPEEASAAPTTPKEVPLPAYSRRNRAQLGLSPSSLFLLRARAALKQVMVDAHHYAQVYLAHARKEGAQDPPLNELYVACAGAALRNTGVTSIETFERLLAKSDYAPSLLKESLGKYLGIRPVVNIEEFERDKFNAIILPKTATATFGDLHGWSTKSGLFSFMG